MSLTIPTRSRPSRIDLVDWSELVRGPLAGLDGCGERLEVEADLAVDLPLALGDPAVLSGLALRLVRRAAEVVGEDWGAVTVGTGVIGYGREPLARSRAIAPLAGRHLVYLEVHSTGPAVAPPGAGLTADPFAARGFAPLDVSKVAALLREFDGEVILDPFATAGSCVMLVLPYASV